MTVELRDGLGKTNSSGGAITLQAIIAGNVVLINNAAGPGSDIILGGPGNDLLYGGPGRDALSGQAGDDALYAKDGARDVADGGQGKDTALVDPRLDRLVGIERHNRR